MATFGKIEAHVDPSEAGKKFPRKDTRHVHYSRSISNWGGR